MGKVKENWILVVFTMVITMSGTLLLNSFTSKNDAIDNAAPYEYVDKCDQEIKEMFITADDDIRIELEKKADKSTVNEIKSDVDYTRGRVDEIYLILIKEDNK